MEGSTNALTASIDWLEFTIIGMPLAEVTADVLDINDSDFSPLAKGRFGYRSQSKWADGNIFLMFNQVDEREGEQRVDSMGVHVMITGSGCRQYEARHELRKLLLFLTILDKQVNFSRIDLAIDDFKDQVINFDRIHDAALARCFTSRWSKWDEVNSRQSASGDFIGRTMYFGSQASDIFCRIYDKGLERKANDEDHDHPEHWTRLELVYRKERATKIVGYMVERQMAVGTALRGTLNTYIRFLTPSQDTNKSRWPSADWWETLLAGVEKLQLTIKKEKRSIDDMAAWINRQIGPTLTAIIKAKNGDMGWLREIIVSSTVRLSQRHLDAIAQYQKQEA